jgi:hypothetical protein
MTAPRHLYAEEGPPSWDDEGPETSPGANASRPLGMIDLKSFLDEPNEGEADLVAGLGLPATGVGMIAGPPKSFKTLLAMQLAISVAAGGGTCPVDFLGREICRGGSVLIVEEEGSLNQLRDRFRRQIGGLGAANPAIDLVPFTGRRLDTDRGAEWLVDAISANGHVAAILDPLGFMHRQDENSSSAMGPIMQQLGRAAREADAHVLVLHHVSKPQANKPTGRLGDRIRGASSIYASLDGLLVLDRQGDRQARLQGESRGSDAVDLYLELDAETLLLRPIDAPARSGGIVSDADLLAFVQERGEVTAGDAMKRFRIGSKETALEYLRRLPGIERRTGPRKVLLFRIKGSPFTVR